MGFTLRCFGDNDGCIADIRDAFSKRIPYRDEQRGVEVIAEVYPLVVLANLVSEFGDLAERVRESKGEALGLRFREKRNDLYRFFQTDDLKRIAHSSETSVTPRLRDLFISEQFVSLVERIVERPLSRHRIDFSSQRYSVGEYLLPHDDRLDSRRIAFVYYVTGPSRGGSLDFFPTDWRAAPTARLGRQSYFPRTGNTLVFFEVSMSSHHQVAPVLQGLRVSFSGWLHDAEPETIRAKVARIRSELPSFVNPKHSLNVLLQHSATRQSTAILVQEALCPALRRDIHQYAASQPSEQIYTTQEAFLSFPDKGEPAWMKLLMSAAFHRFVSSTVECPLDWPTRPILKSYAGPTCFKRIFDLSWRLHENPDAGLVRVFLDVENNLVYLCRNCDVLEIPPGRTSTIVYIEYSCS